MICKICNADTLKPHTLEEKMFGFKGAFRYLECSSCGCLQMETVPEDLSRYYPPYYYSYNQKIPKLKKLPFLKRLFAGMRIKKKYRQGIELFRYLKEINADISDKILDVGCSNGLLICNLFNQGFKNVQGVDVFLPNEIDHGFGVKVHKKEVADLPYNNYNLVMMHHVLEHLPDQMKSLMDIHHVLKDGGCLIIRIPIIGEAWKIYRENWVQLDAPRHLFLHTIQSMDILARKTGFEVKKTAYDSTAFQFWGSELYKRGIPLYSEEHDYNLYPYNKLFSDEELNEFNRKSQELNVTHKGDSAVFYLFKK